MKFNELPQPNKKLSPLMSIRFYCRKLCSCNDLKNWKYCPATRCVLWNYRMGIGNRTKRKKTNEKTPSISQNIERNEVVE